ncbi:MAG TPA: surface lipoprotein assembly modifier [Oxalicibacterium sp.]|nr:surface lipoprotein assembly modifier [Oxalicibacterium sp.]
MGKTDFAKWILIAASLFFQGTACATDALIEQAKQLVESKQAERAYQLLIPLQSERAGEPEYDYVLGVAALDSERAPEAVFAFERVLTLNPENGVARLELARAYYEMGDIKASRAEYAIVQRQQLPQHTSQAVQNYLTAINRIIADSEGTKIRGYLEAGVGHDSNANSATSATQIAIPDIGIGTLDPAATRKGAGFSSLAAGIDVRHPLSSEWTLNTNADITQRSYNDLSQYDIGSLNAAAGLTRAVNADQFTGALQYQKIDLDSASYRQTYGVLGQWQHSIDDQRQFTVYVQGLRLDYAGSQDIRDADRYLVGAAYSQAFDGKYLPVIYAGAYAGTERPTASDVPQLGNDFVGARIGGQISLTAKTLIVAGAGFEHRDYQGEEPQFARERADRQMDLSLALVYMPTNDWIIRPEIAYSRNHSNIVLDDFSRTQYLVTVRRTFN